MDIGTKILIILFIILTLLSFVIIKSKRKKAKKKYPYSYRKKSELMSKCEQEYFQIFLKLLNGRYTIQPQVPLSAIVEKNGDMKYQSELNRVVDFVIFTTFYEPMVAIEINDKSHKTKSRIERDKKVQYILNSAKLPLITIWIDKELNYDDLKKFLISSGVKI